MAFALSLHAGSKTSTMLDLGITGLPDDVAGLKSGRIYAIRAQRVDLRRRLIVQTILHAMDTGRPAVVVAESAKTLISVLSPIVGDRAWEPRVRVFERPAHFREALRAHGAEQFVRELEALDLADGGLLVLEGADALFTGTGAAASTQARIYSQLMRDLNVIGLLMLEHSATLTADQVPARAAFAGIATLNSEFGHLSWDVEHWEGRRDPSRPGRFGLNLRAQAPWLAADGSEFDLLAERISGAPDEDSVFFTRAIMDGDTALPPAWIPLDGYASALTAMDAAIGAALVLHYADHRDLAELCRVIHAVRYQCGRGVKIVVRETTASLRYPEELQVMRAGANAVVYRNQRLARLLGALETLRGHCFAGTIDPDLDRVMTALAPEQQHGYVPPRVFSGLVAATLAKAGEADLEHVLVRLRIRPDKAHVDALTAWQLKRANDLVTADEKDVYLFLFGCRESDVDATLHRLLSVPLATLFSEQVRWQRHEAIRSEIRSLTERAERQPFVDFSLLLPQCSPAATGYRESTRHSSKHRAMTLPTASAIPGNETSPVAATPSSTGPASPGATSERTVVPGRLGVLNRGH